MREKIERFTDEFAFLSNFYPSTISHEGKLWPTVEHAYAAEKTFDAEEKERIRKAETPGRAKSMGRAASLRPDWDSIKVDVMRKLVKEKFRNPILREMLLATGDAELIEGNNWNDTFFGVCRGQGQNWLGRILEEVRDEIRAEIAADEEVNSSLGTG